MATDVGTFVPTQVIFHKVPKDKIGQKDATALDLAEAPIELTPRLIRYFRERIVESLSKRFEVVYDPPPAPPAPDAETPPVAAAAVKRSPIPHLVVDFFNGNAANYVPASVEMAEWLYEMQTGVPNEGILVLVEGVLQTGDAPGKCLVVLKLEPSEALTIDATKNKDGKATFDVKVHDVAFEKKARVFKVALFTRASQLSDITAVVSDPQQGRAGLHEPDVAEFFLRYLGCKFRETADRATKQFMEYVDTFAEKIKGEEDRTKFIIASVAELQSNDGTLDPKALAARALPADLQDEFLAPLRNEDMSVPLIVKDRSRLPARLDNILAEFDGGIRAFGPREQMEKHFKKIDGKWVIDAPFKTIHPASRP
jgi:hypothetical protein